MTEHQIEHRGAVIYGIGEPPPGSEAEQDLAAVTWMENHYANSMRIAAAAVLKQQGSLEKAASLLQEAGFRDAPWAYFSDEEEPDDEDARLRAWVERERDRIARIAETDAFRTAVGGYSY